MAARYYTSTALPTVLASALGASGNPSVVALPGTWPTSFPYCVLLDWGTSAQEAILVTSAPTGSGPYALPCTRGIDNTTQQAHNAGAQAEHGTTGYEPTLIQENAAAIAALEAGVGGGAVALAGDLGNTTADPQVLSTHLSAPLPENQGGTGSASQNWQGLLSPVTQTGTYTATAGQLVKANISSASWTLTLPTAPAANTIIGAKIMANASGNTHALTVACGSGDFFEQSGGGTSVTMSLPLQAAAWQYNSGYWTRVSDDLPLGQLNGLYSEKPATAEVTYYVSAASGASDSNDGLSWGSPKATIAGALTALGSSAGLIQLGAGTFTIAAADGSGNGATLTHVGTCVRGFGMNRTSIVLGANTTYGLVAEAAECEFSGFTLSAATSVTVTYGVGVTTTTSAESCRYSNIIVASGAGTVTNAFAVSPDHHADVAYTTFFGCIATEVTNAGWILGDGTQANVLDTRMFGCVSQGNAYGVYSNATGFQWLGGDMGENTTADVFLASPTGSPVTVQGMRSENSAALFTSSGANTLSTAVSLRDIAWQSGSPVSTGIFISYAFSGTLNLDNVQIVSLTSVVPCLLLSGTAPCVTASGLATTALLSELFSATPTQNASVVVTNYQQVTTSFIQTGTNVTGPVSLFSSGGFTFNGSGRDVMVPFTQPLNSTVLGSAAASITFSSIPSGYSILRLMVTGASAVAAEGDRWAVTVNGDTGAHYDLQTAGGYSGTTSTSASKNAQTEWLFPLSSPGDMPGASATSGVAGVLLIEIPAYSGTTFQKSGLWRSGYSDAATSTTDQVVSNAVISWRSAAAITSITVFTVTGSNLVAGTSAYLYVI